MSKRTILLTGATGYVGGRLLHALEESGYPVRALARRPAFLAGRIGANTTLVRGDCLDRGSLGAALDGIDTAFYLVHSMGSRASFAERDHRAALNFGAAARAAGVRRIIYLGGLGDSGEELSEHLRSRQQTGDALRASGTQVIEFRASIILGSGSLSFELIRALVERLPLMVCPSWVRMRSQPIHIEDVIGYLMAGMELENEENRIFEIGGRDQVSYQDIMKEYARRRGLRRFFVPVPLLTPYLSSLWLGLTTPLYARVGRKLIQSIRNPTVVRDGAAFKTFDIEPVGLRQAIRLAMDNEDRRLAVTRWSDAVSSGGETPSWGGVRFGSRIVDSRKLFVDASPEDAYVPLRRIGGDSGWYHANWLWRLRGFIDLLAGGVGMRRGRRDPEELRVGDTLDFWRVEAYEPDRHLLLRAEMKLPGRAWLEFEVRPEGSGSVIHQTAVFDPVGLPGQLYWYFAYPLHRHIFSGMLRGVGGRIDRLPRHGSSSSDTARANQEAQRA
jgi:uncharacterized protein YbjT (DUF2867 family)